jgi:hypothetical protein
LAKRIEDHDQDLGFRVKFSRENRGEEASASRMRCAGEAVWIQENRVRMGPASSSRKNNAAGPAICLTGGGYSIAYPVQPLPVAFAAWLNAAEAKKITASNRNGVLRNCVGRLGPLLCLGSRGCADLARGKADGLLHHLPD